MLYAFLIMFFINVCSFVFIIVLIHENHDLLEILKDYHYEIDRDLLLEGVHIDENNEENSN